MGRQKEFIGLKLKACYFEHLRTKVKVDLNGNILNKMTDYG